MIWSLPNCLTIGRALAVIPLAAFCFIQQDWAHWAAFAVFIAASATDFLDGHLARARNQITAFGRFLDPIADKLLIATALLALTANGAILGLDVVAAMLILAREILIAGLREHLGGREIVLHVSTLAKWKTAAQMAAIGALLIGEAAPWPVWTVGSVLLWVAALATVVTGWSYFRAAWPYLREEARP